MNVATKVYLFFMGGGGQNILQRLNKTIFSGVVTSRQWLCQSVPSPTTLFLRRQAADMYKNFTFLFLQYTLQYFLTFVFVTNSFCKNYNIQSVTVESPREQLPRLWFLRQSALQAAQTAQTDSPYHTIHAASYGTPEQTRKGGYPEAINYSNIDRIAKNSLTLTKLTNLSFQWKKGRFCRSQRICTVNYFFWFLIYVRGSLVLIVFSFHSDREVSKIF